MPLTDIAIPNAKPRPKATKLSDGAGMLLLATPAEARAWRLKYRIDGKEKLFSIGPYPEIGLAEARKRREAARSLIASGKDPSREKQKAKLTVEELADVAALSPRQFARAFRAETGQTPAKAIEQIRLEAARL